MSILLRATVCSLATTYGIIFNCAGPGCSSLKELPLTGLFCTSDGTTLWCSNQQSCTGSNYTDDFQVTIKNNQVVADDYLVVNGTQFTQRISTQIPRPISETTLSSTTYRSITSSPTQRIAESTSSAKSSIGTSTKCSQTKLCTASHLQPQLQPTQSIHTTTIKTLHRRAGIDFIKALSELPNIAVAKVLGTVDTGYAVAQDPMGVINSVKSAAETVAIAIQGTFLSPMNNILLDIAESRYEDAEKDSLKFVLETTLNAGLVAGAPETGGADLPALVFTHIFAAVMVDEIFKEIDEVQKEKENNGMHCFSQRIHGTNKTISFPISPLSISRLSIGTFTVTTIYNCTVTTGTISNGAELDVDHKIF